ncbi:MAG: flagellar basal body rod protein FlgB [Bacillota bacterium]|nr:flagellar basal body rod protein FlgB [Bacillota bacterium]
MAWLFSGIADQVLTATLDATTLRHQVIASNLANANTPHFKRSEVRFEEVLREALQPPQVLPLATTHPAHISNAPPSALTVRPEVVPIQDTRARIDGNNVDPDQEMAKLARNSLLYSAAVQMLDRRFSSLKSAITEGRR